MSRKKNKASKRITLKKEPAQSIREKQWWHYVLDFSVILSAVLATIAFLTQSQTKPPPALSPSDLHVQIGSFQLAKRENMPIFLGIDNFDKKAVYIGIIPLVIHNSGRSTIRDISVISSFPKLSREGLFELLEMKNEGPLRKKMKSILDFQEVGHKSLHVVNLDRINPGINIGIDQPFVFAPTQINFIVEPVDGIKLPVNVEYSLQVDYSISAENTPESDFETTIAVKKAKSKDAISNDAVRFVYKRIINDRNKLSWLEKAIFSQTKETIVGFTKPKLSAKTDNGNLYEVRYLPEDLRILSVSYKPKWPKYILCVMLPILIVIFLFRFGCRQKIISLFKRKN